MLSRTFCVLLCLIPAFIGAMELDPLQTGAMPGDAAPSLVVSKWLRGEPVDRYEHGRIYVIDLWATWCAPCLKSMPRMSRLQAQYAKDVTVVAMNVWELKPERIPKILEALGDSMAVTVAVDSLSQGKEANEGMTAVAYMGMSEIVSLPRTILIDREGRVAWIGSPQELVGPLTRVLDGTWELEPFATTYIANMEIELDYRQLLRKVEAAIANADWEAAYRASEDIVATNPSFARRIARAGFVFIAMKILKTEQPGKDAALARRAAERGLELWAEPDWRLSKLAADAANAAGDFDAAREHLRHALESAPDQERAQLTATLEALAKRR